MTTLPSQKQSRDHPRSRGVYGLHPVELDHLGGSSPLARGLQRNTERNRTMKGIIPARAGFTSSKRSTGKSPTDHPRSRGVYVVVIIGSFLSAGSSPLARGLLPGRRRRRDRGGIIPARAGFTPTHPGHGRGCQDHPRSRGVYRIRPRSSQKGTGSSPLARGLLRRPPLCHSLYWDHPRSRGVYSLSDVMAQNRPGSSPLARGLHITGR